MTASALILAGYGLNCEEETQYALEYAGIKGTVRHINDLIDAPQELDNTQILVIPGGFSYGDDTGSGNGFAQKMRLALWEPLQKFIARDTLTLGICNGCQIITNLGLVPAIDKKYGHRVVAVTHNITARYGCRWIDVKVSSSKSPWLEGVSSMHIPVAHGEGRFMMDQAILKTLERAGQIALTYTKPDGSDAGGEFPYNPNGSQADIAGITDPTGKVLAVMPHPERGMFTWQRDDYDRLKDQAQREGAELPETADGMALFQNAAKYFEVAKKKRA